MFARVIFRDTGHESLYECDHIHFNQIDKKDAFIVDFESENDCVSVEIDKQTCDLYIMNNDGKTIDSYQWNGIKIDKQNNFYAKQK